MTLLTKIAILSLTVATLVTSGCRTTSSESEVKTRGTNWREYHAAEMARLETITKRMSILKAGVQNADAMTRVGIQRTYLAGYGHYANSYARYTQNLIKHYRRSDDLRDGLMQSYQYIRKFNNQSKTCSARARTLWRRNLPGANAEVFNRNIYFRNIGTNFRFLGAKKHGEICTELVLAEKGAAERRISGELLHLKFDFNKDPGAPGRKIAVVCPAKNPEFKTPAAEEGGESKYTPDPMVYPPVDLVKDESGRGWSIYYHPVTYYQLYALLTDPEVVFEVGEPAGDDAPPVCGFRASAERTNHDYYKASIATEKEIARDLATGIKRGQSTEGRYAIIGSNTSSHYKTLYENLKVVLEEINACVDGMAGAGTSMPQPEGNGGFNLDDTAPWEGVEVDMSEDMEAAHEEVANEATDPVNPQVAGNGGSGASDGPSPANEGAGSPGRGGASGAPDARPTAADVVAEAAAARRRNESWPPSYTDPAFYPRYIPGVELGYRGAYGGVDSENFRPGAGFDASTDPLLAGSFDPRFPMMDDSINKCLLIAEHYRQKAMENREAIASVLDTLSTTGDEPPSIPTAPTFPPPNP